MKNAYAAIAFALVTATSLAAADEIATEAVNHTTPTLCAESDNVDIRLSSSSVRRFRITAVHPPYIGALAVDRTEPDFTGCDMSSDPVFAAPPRRVTIWESADWWLVGHSFATFWRPNVVSVRVDQRVETGLHLLQLWHWHHERSEEVLVLYPADGYWRARPLAPSHLRATAYGSSFLIGPVEVQRRPIVDIRSVSFDPATRRFTLEFTRGGSATLAVEQLGEDRIVLDVTLSTPPDGPFAALRSMFVTESNADVARLEWRAPGAIRWQSAPASAFERASLVALRAGRDVPSRHNTSAPDLIFDRFAAR